MDKTKQDNSDLVIESFYLQQHIILFSVFSWVNFFAQHLLYCCCNHQFVCECAFIYLYTYECDMKVVDRNSSKMSVPPRYIKIHIRKNWRCYSEHTFVRPKKNRLTLPANIQEHSSHSTSILAYYIFAIVRFCRQLYCCCFPHHTIQLCPLFV